MAMRWKDETLLLQVIPMSYSLKAAGAMSFQDFKLLGFRRTAFRKVDGAGRSATALTPIRIAQTHRILRERDDHGRMHTRVPNTMGTDARRGGRPTPPG